LIVLFGHVSLRIIVLVSDFSVDVQVVWQLNATVLTCLMNVFVNLDDASHWLTINLVVVIDDHVQTIITDCANTLGLQGVHVTATVLL